MSDIAVVTNTEKLLKKDARKLREALATAGIKDAEWLEVTKGSESKDAAIKAVKHGARTLPSPPDRNNFRPQAISSSELRYFFQPGNEIISAIALVSCPF